MQVFSSPDDDRRAGACAPLVRKPVAAQRIPATQATVSARVERSTTSGTSGRFRPGTGVACGAVPSGRRWSTALAADNNEGYRRELWLAARPAVTALTFRRLIRGNSSTNRRRTDATATNG
jgi:hypothetical protein